MKKEISFAVQLIFLMVLVKKNVVVAYVLGCKYMIYTYNYIRIYRISFVVST